MHSLGRVGGKATKVRPKKATSYHGATAIAEPRVLPCTPRFSSEGMAGQQVACSRLPYPKPAKRGAELTNPACIYYVLAMNKRSMKEAWFQGAAENLDNMFCETLYWRP